MTRLEAGQPHHIATTTLVSGMPSEIRLQQQLLPYDTAMLERAKEQWQFADWASLAAVDAESLEHHPDRAKMALLVASAHLQQGEQQTARQFVRLARDWGCDKRLISRVLIAGVYNSLGRVELARSRDQKGLRHFEEAITTVLPHSDQKLFGEARAVREAAQLGLLPQAAGLMDAQLAAVKNASRRFDSARVSIIETELQLLHSELSLAQQRQQLFPQPQDAAEDVEPMSPDEWRARLKQKSVSQLGQDLWVLEKAGYKRDGFFVEFGATDGVLLSNTWLLERQFGWKGLCAEPNPKFFEQLKQNRACVVSNAYIGGETGEAVEFILSDAYGGSSQYAQDDQHAGKRAAYKQVGQVKMMESISLNDFLEQHGAPREIDYISIDTEGSEYEILNTFPFDKWRVRLFTIEHNFTERRKDIRQLMEKSGYICKESKWDDWYELTAHHEECASDDSRKFNGQSIYIQANYKKYPNQVEGLQKKYLDFPRTVSIETLVRCNAKCNFCPYPKSPRKEQRLSDELYLKIIDDLTRISRDHSFGFTLTRINEPLLDQRLEYFSDVVAEYLPNAVQAFWSNGTTLVPGRFEWIGKKYHNSSLTISLNSMDEADHREMMGFGLKKIIGNLDYLHELVINKKFLSRVLLCAPFVSLSKAEDFATKVQRRWPKFNFGVRPFFQWMGDSAAGSMYRDDIGMPDQDLQQEISSVGDFSCGQWFDLHILASGYVTKCCIDESGYDGNPAYDVRLNDVLDIYRSTQDLRKRLPSRKDLPACSFCLHLG